MHIVGAKRGLVVDVQAEDAELGIRSLTVAFNGKELGATAVNHAGIETTVTAETTVRPGNGKAQTHDKGN